MGKREKLHSKKIAVLVISDGFEWDLENSEIYHISGNLKIKNNFEGVPIIGQDTRSFKLVFKDIGSSNGREHVYEGDKLRNEGGEV
jgi:hypothetical protein